MAGTIAVDGLISGFNTTDMIDKIMAAESQSVTLLQTRQRLANARLDVFRALNTRLLSFQDAASTLARLTAFSAKTASVSHESLLGATAARTAAAGTYAVTVNALARAHQVASQGFADVDSTPVGTGTLQIQVGRGETATLTIDAASNTLAGLCQAINAANAGVTATIINDGSAALPYRLLLTANQAGAANTLSVASSLSGGTAPEFNAGSVGPAVADDANYHVGTVTSGGTYTGTTNKAYVVEFVQGGAVGAATYRVSDDGGLTWGSTQVLASGTIDVYDNVHGSDLGVDATFTIPANTIDPAVPDPGNSYPGTATSGGTYTGTTDRAYLIRVTHSGSLGNARYRISEDGGATWGSERTFPSGGTINVYDNLHSSDLGVDATFTSGSFSTGDQFTIQAHVPPAEQRTFAAGDRFLVDAFVPTVQQAADAELLVGSGAGQVAIRSASNTVTDALPGLTLTLKKADPTETVTITVANDTDTVEQNIQAFVDQYNSVIDYIRQQTRYNAETQEAGILLGDPSVTRIQQDLRGALLGTVPGLPAGFNGLYAVGISVSATGQLTLDSDKLTDALTNHFDDVARLFEVSGESSNAKIRFLAASGDTQASPAGYAVQITQAATRGSLTGTTIADPAVSPLTIDGTNDSLVLILNGVATSVLALSHKTYRSGSELAAELAAKINASQGSVSTVDVTFVDDGATGHLEIRTRGYGSTWSVELGEEPANSAAAVLGLAGATAAAGQNVAGTIDGCAATGSGRILKAADASSPAQGLQVEVTLTPAEIGGGVSALVTVIKGVARASQDLLDFLTDPIDGYVKSKEARYDSQVQRLSDQIARRQKLLDARRERLVQQFARLEQALGQLRSQGDVLTAQFEALSGMTTQ